MSSTAIRAFARCTAVSLLVGSIILSRIWPQLVAGYPNDSFHTLQPFSAIGLCIVAAIGITMMLLISRWQSRAIERIGKLQGRYLLLADIVIGFLLYWLILSLSPQFFYLYYWFVFDNLPQQWVVQRLLPWSDYLDLWLLLENASIASHAAGMLGWILLIGKIVRNWGIVRSNNQ